MRAVCYPRVSSAQQREKDSIASQIRELPLVAERMGWELVKPVDTYIDDGFTAKSGKLQKRRGLLALLRDAGAGLFDVVIMRDFSRLTRAEDLAERGMILGALQAAGVRVATTTGEIVDLNTEHGDLIASLMTVRAAAENRAKAKSIRDGKLTRAMRGGKQSGPDPYGHRYDKATNTWSLDPVRAPFVVEMFERLAAGESCISIAVDFERRRVPRDQRHHGNPRPWDKSHIRYIARSTRPMGEYLAHRASRITVAVPPIVSVELWQRAQDALLANRKNGLRRTQHVYLLERLGVCGLCGAKMRMRSAILQKGKWERPAAYVCENRLPHLPKALRDPNATKCTNQMKVHDADAIAWEQICGAIEDPELPAELAGERRDIATDQRCFEADVQGYRDHLTRLGRVEEAIWTRFRRGDIEEASLDRELAKVRRERAAVSTQLRHAEKARGATINAQSRLGEASAMMDRLRAKAAAASPEERREIAATLIDPGGAVFYPDEIRIELVIDCAGASTHGDSRALAVEGFLTDDHQSHLRIQVVARLTAA